MAFHFLTAGESHGECLTAVSDGMPSGLVLTEDHINADLARRQRGSVDVTTREAVEAVVERSDVCAVPAAGVVGEAMMALARAFLDTFGGDSVDEIRKNHDAYLQSLKTW